MESGVEQGSEQVTEQTKDGRKKPERACVERPGWIPVKEKGH